MPVGASVDEGVAMLRYGGALRPSARCLYEAEEHVGGRLPARVVFPFLPRRVRCSRGLAYKTTRKYISALQVKALQAIAVESPLICAS